MTRKDLLESEKKVLYGLVKYSGSTDQTLSKILGMKVPTITAIRMKLKKKGYYETKAIPNMQYLGAEMLTISYVVFSSHPSLENKLKEGRRVLNKEEFVYAISEANQDFFIQISKNYTDARRNVEEIEGAYKGISYFVNNITSVQFPFELCEIPYYFDYAPLLEKAFGFQGLGTEEEKVRPLSQIGAMPAVLSNKERTVLFGLVKYPGLNDIELADRVNASRMTIGKTRKKLMSQNMIRTINIPNLEMIGFELLVVTHGKFNMAMSEGLKFYVSELLKRIGPGILTAFGKNEIIMINMFRDFQEFKNSMAAFTQVYKEHEVFSEPPRRLLFSLNNMITTKNHDYSSFVGKIMGMKPTVALRK